MAWYSGEIVRGELSLHYTRTGGDKPPVVMAHGFSDHGLCWTPIAKALEDDYDLIMVDARGHGLTKAPQELYGITERGDDLAVVIEALGLDRPVILGHSMGAATVATCAAHHPKSIRAAIMEDPPWFAPEPGSAPARFSISVEERQASMREMQAKGKEGLIAQCRADSPTWPEDELDIWAESKLQFQVDMLPYARAEYADWRDAARRIVCPALLIIGDTEKGALVSLDVAAEALRIVPQLEVRQIQGVGHSIRREGREQYLEAVRDFLRQAHMED